MGLKTYNPHTFLRKIVEFPETKAGFKPRRSMPGIWIFLEEHKKIRCVPASAFNIYSINIIQEDKLLLFDYNCTGQFEVSPLCNSKRKEKWICYQKSRCIFSFTSLYNTKGEREM